MKKKILFGSILAALLMLSMPVISNAQAKLTITSESDEPDECDFCIARELIRKYASGNLNIESLLSLFRPLCWVLAILALICASIEPLWDLFWDFFFLGAKIGCWSDDLP
jgi:hypothetical protein